MSVRHQLVAREAVNRAIRRDTHLIAAITALSDAVLETLSAGHKLLFAGNGGSAADAQHLAAEYVGRFQRERPALPAIALTTDTSILTAIANDYGFREIFVRQLRALAVPGDLLIMHSTSGRSENLIAVATEARLRGIQTAALLARGGGQLADIVDHAVIIPTNNGAIAQELHLAVGHIICGAVEARLYP